MDTHNRYIQKIKMTGMQTVCGIKQCTGRIEWVRKTRMYNYGDNSYQTRFLCEHHARVFYMNLKSYGGVRVLDLDGTEMINHVFEIKDGYESQY